MSLGEKQLTWIWNSFKKILVIKGEMQINVDAFV
jgi:hypothetical protein